MVTLTYRHGNTPIKEKKKVCEHCKGTGISPINNKKCHVCKKENENGK